MPLSFLIVSNSVVVFMALPIITLMSSELHKTHYKNRVQYRQTLTTLLINNMWLLLIRILDITLQMICLMMRISIDNVCVQGNSILRKFND